MTILCQCHGRYGFTRVDADFVCGRCGLPTRGYESTQTKIVFFRGGPLDSKAYNSDDLLHAEFTSRIPEVSQYRWTSEKVTSQLTGQTARVWEWNPDYAKYAPDSTTDKETPTMAQNTTADGQTPETLLQRRKDLGISRTPVAEKAGITVSQLSSLETSGKRIKEGVMDAVHAALAHFEKEKGTTSEPSDSEDHAVPVQ